MPEIKLQFGKMDLESDPTGKNETVSAILFNAYRNGESILRSPGLTQFAAVGDLPAFVFYSTLHNVCLSVCGTKLFKVLSDGTSSEVLGAAFTSGNPACFSEDATRIFITAYSGIHVYTVATGAVAILGGQAPVDVTWISVLRGYVITNGTDPLGGSLPGDFAWCLSTLHPTLDVWEYEGNAAKPDGLMAVITTPNDDIFMIGRESIEVNVLTGDATAPFAVIKSASQSYGTPCAASVAYDGQNMYMVVIIAGTRQILRLTGGRTPQLIGFPVGTPMDDITDLTDMRGFVMGAKGRTFYVLTCPSTEITVEGEQQNGITLVFDIRNEEWHVWGNWNSQSTQYEAYRGVSFAYAEPWGNKRLIGGDDGRIYLMDDSHSFGPDPIRMVLRTGHRTHGTIRWKNCIEYAYDFKAGVGNVDCPSPAFSHRWRNDGSLEWSTPRVINMGAVGDRSVPQKSRQCGRYRKRQDELIFSDAVEVVFSPIYEEVEVLK